MASPSRKTFVAPYLGKELVDRIVEIETKERRWVEISLPSRNVSRRELSRMSAFRMTW